MSTIGKIFLVLNLVLAAAFVGYAANSLGKTEELKKRLDGELTAANTKLTATEAELSQKLSELKTERQAKDTAQAERGNFETESKRLKEDLDASKRQNDQLRADVAKINETMSGLNERLAQIEQSKDAAQAMALKMQGERDQAVSKAEAAETARRTAEEQRKSGEMQIAQLEKDGKKTRNELDKVSAELTTLIAETGVAREAIAGVPELQASVVKVDTSLKPGLVALNVGSNQGVKRGHTFEIFSGTTYKGRVKVEQVHPDMCSALILVAGQGQITAGDSAATRL